MSEPMRVRKAVIPAAGHGARMRPVTLVVPKELLPVGSRPAIHFALEELVTAGLTSVAIVINREKELIRRYVEALTATRPFDSLQCEFIYQEPPVGLGEALSSCRDYAADEPFVLLLPDAIPMSPDYQLSSLLETFEETQRDVIGVVECDSAQPRLCGHAGLMDYELSRPGVVEVKRLHAKHAGTLEVVPGARILRGCGRLVCRPHIFDYIDRVRSQTGAGKLDDAPVLKRLAEEKGAVGVLVPLPVFDVGTHRGYLSASAYLHSQFAP